MRAHILITTFAATLTAGVSAAPALAHGNGRAAKGRISSVARIAQTGGTTAAPELPQVKRSATGKPAHRRRAHKARYRAPITAEHQNLEYTGPLYELTASGQTVPYMTEGESEAVSHSTGGSVVGVAASTTPELLVPGRQAKMINGLAAAPMGAPRSVQEMIWTANQIIGRPYIYGGGHRSFISHGYDCSGTVSFALHGASLIKTPMDSSEMMIWGDHGIGKWVTIFSNPGHAYMTVAGLRLDTSSADDPSNLQGPRWRPLRPANAGFVKRHPEGL